MNSQLLQNIFIFLPQNNKSNINTRFQNNLSLYTICHWKIFSKNFNIKKRKNQQKNVEAFEVEENEISFGCLFLSFFL